MSGISHIPAWSGWRCRTPRSVRTTCSRRPPGGSRGSPPTARMRANLDATGGLIYTSAALLELVRAGMSREDGYALVQQAAMETWDTGTPFRVTLRALAKARGQQLDEPRLDEACRPERYVE